MNAQITQVLKFKTRRYLGNYKKKHALKQDVSQLCNLYTSHQIDACLRLYSCYKNKCINNLWINKHNKVVHTLATTHIAIPSTCCFTLINTGKINSRFPKNTLPLWLLPCTCYLPICTCPTRLRPNILCFMGDPPTTKPPFSPSPHRKV